MPARPHDESSSAASASGADSKHGDPEAQDLGPLISEPHTERPLWHRALFIALAVLCFALGVVGWLVPVITGIPFYVVGLVCLAKASPWMAARINALDERLSPRVRRALRWRPSWLRRDDASSGA